MQPLPSLIVKSGQHNEMLQKWVKEGMGGNVQFTLLWQGSRDGFRAETFHAKCDNKGPTLTVLQGGEGHVFGAFTSVSWTSPEKDTITHDPTAFVYSINQSTRSYKQNNNNSVISCKEVGPTFGYGDEYGYDLQIVDNCDKNSNSLLVGSTYDIPSGSEPIAFLAGGNDYTIREIEVYAVSKS